MMLFSTPGWASARQKRTRPLGMTFEFSWRCCAVRVTHGLWWFKERSQESKEISFDGGLRFGCFRMLEG